MRLCAAAELRRATTIAQRPVIIMCRFSPNTPPPLARENHRINDGSGSIMEIAIMNIYHLLHRPRTSFRSVAPSTQTVIRSFTLISCRRASAILARNHFWIHFSLTVSPPTTTTFLYVFLLSKVELWCTKITTFVHNFFFVFVLLFWKCLLSTLRLNAFNRMEINKFLLSRQPTAIYDMRAYNLD